MTRKKSPFVALSMPRGGRARWVCVVCRQKLFCPKLMGFREEAGALGRKGVRFFSNTCTYRMMAFF